MEAKTSDSRWPESQQFGRFVAPDGSEFVWTVWRPQHPGTYWRATCRSNSKHRNGKQLVFEERVEVSFAVDGTLLTNGYPEFLWPTIRVFWAWPAETPPDDQGGSVEIPVQPVLPL